MKAIDEVYNNNYALRPCSSFMLTFILMYDKLRNGINSKTGVVALRVTIHLACTECKERNYTTNKNKKTNADRLEMKKFCPRCGRHTVHKETK